MSILRMDVIHGAVGGEAKGSQVNIQRKFSVTHLSIRYIKQGVGVGQNPLSIVTKVICRCMLTVVKSELSFSLFFLFIFFLFFLFFSSSSFLFFFLFHFLFRIIFIQNIIYFLDEENSGLVTCSMWLHSNGLFHRKNPKTQVTQDVENLGFLGILKKKHMEISGVN